MSCHFWLLGREILLVEGKHQEDSVSKTSLIDLNTETLHKQKNQTQISKATNIDKIIKMTVFTWYVNNWTGVKVLRKKLCIQGGAH